MTYQEFKTSIHNQVQLKNYYELLLQFSNEIVEETLSKQKTTLASELNLSQPKFSTLLPLLIAHRNIRNSNV